MIRPSRTQSCLNVNSVTREADLFITLCWCLYAVNEKGAVNVKKIQRLKLAMVQDAIERVRGIEEDSVKRKAEISTTAAGPMVYECDPSIPLSPGAIDGMAEFIEDEPITGLEWDIEIENPPYVGKDFDMALLPHPNKPHPKRWV